MDFNINLTIQSGPDGEITQRLENLLNLVITMNQTIQELASKVERLITVDESAIALIQGLKAQLDEAIATGDLAEVQALSIRMGESTEALAAAVAANTPVAPTDPVDPAPAESVTPEIVET